MANFSLPEPMVDVTDMVGITKLSKATIWRMHADGILPRGLKIGRSVRWRLRTGNPQTGVLDWIEAGCPRCVAADDAQQVSSLEGCK